MKSRETSAENCESVWTQRQASLLCMIVDLATPESSDGGEERRYRRVERKRSVNGEGNRKNAHASDRCGVDSILAQTRASKRRAPGGHSVDERDEGKSERRGSVSSRTRANKRQEPVSTQSTSVTTKAKGENDRERVIARHGKTIGENENENESP